MDIPCNCGCNKALGWIDDKNKFRVVISNCGNYSIAWSLEALETALSTLEGDKEQGFLVLNIEGQDLYKFSYSQIVGIIDRIKFKKSLVGVEGFLRNLRQEKTQNQHGKGFYDEGHS